MIKLPRIKLQWGTAKEQPGNWYLGLLGFYDRKGGGRSRGLAISLRGILLWGLAACVAGYFAIAGYVFWKLDRRPYNFVRYTDILLYPLRYKQIDELRGQGAIAEGFDELKKGNWRGGVMQLRIGLEKYPRDLKARLEVAKFFLAAKLRVKAQEMLFQGLEHGYPGRAYLEAAIGVVSAGEDYEMVVDLCDRALKLHDPARHAASDRRWLLEQRIRALLAEKRNEDALAFAESQAGEVDDAVLSELRLLALFQAGRFADAVAFAEAWRARVGPTAQVRRLQARSYREAGRGEDMARVLEELRRESPADPRVRVFSIVQNLMAGRVEDARAQLDDYIFRFGGMLENYVLLAEPLAEIKRLPEIETLLAAANERGLFDARLPAARLQVLISERRWAEAKTQLDEIRAKLPAVAVGRATLLELLQNLIDAASDPAEGAQTTLTNFIAVRQLPMSAYRQCLDVLRTAGRISTAREVVRLAEGVFPSNRYLAETRTALDAELAAAAAAAEAARGVKVAAPAFASPATFYAALDQAKAREGRGAALALIRELRQTGPVWLADETEPLGRRELELEAEGDDIVALQAAVRRYVNEDRIRIQHTIAVATRLHEAGRAEDARIVLDEVLRRVPGQPAAVALKAKWFPPKPAPAAAEGEKPSAPAPGSASVSTAAPAK